MVWMGAVIRVIMGHCISKRVGRISGALGATVDMKAENRILTWMTALRKSKKFSRNQCAVNGLVKADFSLQIRVGFASLDIGNSLRRKV